MSRVRPAHPTTPPTPRGILCPYCGRISVNPRRCDGCGGFFDPLSRQATQNAMGPWFLRDPANPHGPGCSYETLKEMIKRGRIRPDTILRGPTTRQFWNFAARTPTVANLLGLCHNCHAKVSTEDYSCAACGAVFTPETDRQHLGLAPVHLLPGQAAPEIIAASVQPPPEIEPLASAPVRRPRDASAPSAGRSAIHAAPEAEREPGTAGKVLAVIGILVVLGAAVGGVIYITRLLNPPAVPTSQRAVAPTPAQPAPTAANPPATPPSQQSGTAAPAESGSVASTGAPVPPTAGAGSTGAEPSPQAPPAAPPATPAETPKAAALPISDLVPRLSAGLDDAATSALIQTIHDSGRDDAAAWESLVRRRAEQLKVKGLP